MNNKMTSPHSARMLSEDAGIYETRLLIFLETSPQSNKYCQVILSKREFKKTSLTLGKIVDKKGKQEKVTITLSQKEFTLPDLQSNYK